MKNRFKIGFSVKIIFGFVKIHYLPSLGKRVWFSFEYSSICLLSLPRLTLMHLYIFGLNTRASQSWSAYRTQKERTAKISDICSTERHHQLWSDYRFALFPYRVTLYVVPLCWSNRQWAIFIFHLFWVSVMPILRSSLFLPAWSVSAHSQMNFVRKAKVANRIYLNWRFYTIIYFVPRCWSNRQRAIFIFHLFRVSVMPISKSSPFLRAWSVAANSQMNFVRKANFSSLRGKIPMPIPSSVHPKVAKEKHSLSPSWV